MSQKYSIGDVAKKLNITTHAIRFYDQKDLVKPEFVGENGYRYYGDEQIQRLELINYLRGLNFSIKQIKQLFNDQKGSDSLLLLFQNQIEENDAQIADLKQKHIRLNLEDCFVQTANKNHIVQKLHDNISWVIKYLIDYSR